MKKLEPYERALKARALLMYAARKDSELLATKEENKDMAAMVKKLEKGLKECEKDNEDALNSKKVKCLETNIIYNSILFILFTYPSSVSPIWKETSLDNM